MSETLMNEIRATKPEAPSALRERVRALSVQEPVREPFLDRLRFTWGWRRLVLVVPATLVVALLAAGVIGLSRDRSAGDEQTASPFASDAGRNRSTVSPSGSAESSRAAPPATKAGEDAAGGAVAPVPGQLQRFEAELSLRVDDVEALS